MSTIKTTYLQHPSASSPNLTLASDGTVSGGAGLGGLVHIATESFTGVSSVSLDNVFSSTYDNYRLVMRFNCSNTTELVGRLRQSAVDATGADYARAVFRIQPTTTFTLDSNATASTVFLLTNNTLGGENFVTADLSNPYVASVTNMTHTTQGGDRYYSGFSRHGVSSQYDGFSVFPNAGTASGTVSVYGYRNS